MPGNEELFIPEVLAGHLYVGHYGYVYRTMVWDSRKREYSHCSPARIDEEGRDGYRRVRLNRKNRVMVCHVHRLVWRVYRGQIPEGVLIHHQNRCRWDNRLENLGLATPLENIEHAIVAGALERGVDGRWRQGPPIIVGMPPLLEVEDPFAGDEDV